MKTVAWCVVSLSSLLFAFTGAAQQAAHFPGVTPVGKSAISQDVTLTLPEGGTVDQVKVFTQGSSGLDFQNAGDDCKEMTFLPGQSCNVRIAFTPAVPGERRGAIVLMDRSNHTLAIRPMAATASGAVATFIPGLISTVAGNASRFLFSGDGGPATAASLFLPSGLVLDGAGNMFIADTYNNRIREVNASTGIINTVAGNGKVTYSGDGVSALSVGLDNPSSVALDASGNLYIADSYNNAIRVVNAATGVITTIAGNGAAAYAGDGGLALAASLNTPNGISLDANNNLYIADTGNNVVRLVSASTGIISTVAGTGLAANTGDGGPAIAATLNGPWGVTVTTSGTFYIADQKNNALRMVNTAGVITTIAGGTSAGPQGDGGPATAAKLSLPSYVLIDIAGNIYISDTQNNRIRKINPQTGIITTIAGSGGDPDRNPATLASLYGPYAIALDGQGNLFIADAAHNRIREVASNMGILNYAILRAGSVSPPMSQVLENDGTTALNISSVAAVSNAQVDPATTCTSTTSLASLGQCTIVAEFAPATTNVVGTIAVNSNALNANSTLILQGGVQSTYPATVILSSSPNPSIVGNPVLFSVQVVNAGGIVATGTITLLDGTTTIATQQLVNGNASISVSTLAVGQHTITASYGGDTNDSSGVSLPIVQVVTAQPPNSTTTTSLTSSVNPSNVGQAINLNATVSAVTSGQAAPTGSVMFLDGSTSIGTATLNAGTASLSISTLALGTHQLTAVYGGSSSYTGSTSSTLPQVVVAPNTITTTSLTSSADPIGVGSNLTLLATVASATPGQPVPAGTVSFMQGTTLLGTVALVSGSASYSTTSLPVGTYTLTAVYSGSSAYSASTSPPLTEIVVSTSTGNSPQFTLTATPSTVTLQSGSHTTLALSITTLPTFADTLSLGCGGLPKAATCTFSQAQLTLAGNVTKTLTVDLDTGNPLGSGPSSKLTLPDAGTSSGVLACILPAGGLLALLFGRRWRRSRLSNLLVLAVIAGTLMTLAGCGSSTPSVNSTSPGTYTISIFANGSSTGATYAVPVQLTVTK